MKISAPMVTAVAIAATLASVAPAQAGSISYFRTDTPEFRASAKFGKQMFVAYQCAKCHATREGQALTDAIVAPNLHPGQAAAAAGVDPAVVDRPAGSSAGHQDAQLF